MGLSVPAEMFGSAGRTCRRPRLHPAGRRKLQNNLEVSVSSVTLAGGEENRGGGIAAEGGLVVRGSYGEVIFSLSVLLEWVYGLFMPWHSTSGRL
ncbi:MAG: hypothetical protein U0936_11175 [Planctomycetaceae bacterium]